MRRRRDLRSPAAPAVSTQTPKPPAPGGAQMRVEIEGDPDTVRNKLGMNDGDKGKEKETGDEDAVFLEALKKAEYRFQIKRILPREWQGRDARLVVMEDACPMLYQDIVDEVTKSSGGRKFRAVVFNPSDGKSVAAKTFTVEADPILPRVVDDGASLQDLIEEEQEPDDNERIQRTFNNQIKMAEQQLTLERTQEMLDSLRNKRSNGKGNPAEDERIRLLEKKLDEERHQRELDRQKAESDRKYDELQRQLTEIKANQNKGGDKSDIALVLESMKTMQEESNRRFEKFLEKSREDKVDEILRRMEKSHSQGGLGTLAEQVKAFRDIKGLLDGDDGDDREWWEKLIDHVPKIMDRLADMSKGGKKVSKEDFLKEIDAAAERATKEEIAKLETQAPAPRRALPAPAPAAVPAPENSQGSVGRPVTKPVKVDALPPAAPTAAPEPAAAPAAEPSPAAPAAPAAPVQSTPDPKQAAEIETLRMAAGVICMIEVELETRKRLYQWNYEGAWQNLPEPLLEKVCMAEEPVQMLAAFMIPGMPGEMVQKIEAIRTKITTSPRAMRWLAAGHKELQRWWQKLEEDPEFDPADEEEEGEEHEEESQA